MPQDWNLQQHRHENLSSRLPIKLTINWNVKQCSSVDQGFKAVCPCRNTCQCTHSTTYVTLNTNWPQQNAGAFSIAPRLAQNCQFPDKNSRYLLRTTWNFLRYFKICIYDIPRFLAEVLTMFFGTLVGKHCSRWLPALWIRTFCLHLYGIRIDKTEGGVTIRLSLWNVGITELNHTVLNYLLLFLNLGSVSKGISTQ
jgi:hypothetical protein